MFVYILNHNDYCDCPPSTIIDGIYSEQGIKKRKAQIIEEEKQKNISFIKSLNEDAETWYSCFKRLLNKSETFLPEEKKYNSNKHSQEYREIHKKRIELLKEAEYFRLKYSNTKEKIKRYEKETEEDFWQHSPYWINQESVLDY